MSGWVLWNERDDRPAAVETFPTLEQAMLVLSGYIERDARGGRPDLHDIIPHIVVRQQTPTCADTPPHV